MSATDAKNTVLEPGQKLSLDEFLRRWEGIPHLKRAELIGGIVYMPSPLKADHGDGGFIAGTWLGVYSSQTPGTRGSDNATTIMDEDCPQPDYLLRLLPEAGGRVRIEKGYVSGAPEFVVEVCGSSADYDLGVKKDLYERQGVDEYVAVLLREKEVRWHRWEEGGYQVIAPDEAGIWRSNAFPGLWLDGTALLDGDLAKVLAMLQQGLESPEHAEFVARLKQRMGAAT